MTLIVRPVLTAIILFGKVGGEAPNGSRIFTGSVSNSKRARKEITRNAHADTQQLMKVVKQMRDVGNDTEASIVNYGSAQVRCDPGEVAAIAGPLGAEHIYGPPDPPPSEPP